MKHIQFHKLYFDEFDSTIIYLDDDLYPQIDISEFFIE